MIYHDLSSAELVEESVRRKESQLTRHGALVAYTGQYTGRAANDKYLVKDAKSESLVDWGRVNRPIAPEDYQKLRRMVLSHLEMGDSFVQHRSVGADPRYSLPLRIQTEYAWHALFARTMFRPPFEERHPENNLPQFNLYCAPSVQADPGQHNTRSGVFIAINFSEHEIIIGGTMYAGEIKKSVFTVMNYVLPQLGVMTMHCAANLDDEGHSALFFGLSGTGKTTLSTDSQRRLLGDDEHGWTRQGIFNVENGCYAKMIKLSPTSEPEIYACAHRFGTVLENVVMDAKSRHIDLDSAQITENTRGAYELSTIPNVELSGVAGPPNAVIMLACDAYGVLPPVAKLSPDQAMYYFLSGYTAKVAGTEAGMGSEPQSTFSACFGEPFMALSPTVYAKLLGERLRETGAACYLVNTGWWKGGYGRGGERMPIAMSRALVRAAVSGELADAPMERDPLFGFEVPTDVHGIASEHLRMENTWSDREAYQAQAKKLASMFVANFHRYDGKIGPEVAEAGPRG